MTDATSLYLVTPLVSEPEAIAPALEAACGTGRVAAILLRLAPADERSLINRIKSVAQIVQSRDAALIVALPESLDPVTLAGRGGADGLHVPASADLRDLRDRLRDGRVLGVGALRTRHEAMSAGEAGVDYVMFGEPRPDGSVPDPEGVVERAEWWAPIFSTPCVAFAASLEHCADLAATGAEFVALGEAIWDHPAGPQAGVEQACGLIARAVPA